MGAYVSKSYSNEKQEAAKAINALLEQAQSLIWEAEGIAHT